MGKFYKSDDFFLPGDQVLSIYWHSTGYKPGALLSLACYKEPSLFNGRQEESGLRSPKYMWKALLDSGFNFFFNFSLLSPCFVLNTCLYYLLNFLWDRALLSSVSWIASFLVVNLGTHRFPDRFSWAPLWSRETQVLLFLSSAILHNLFFGLPTVSG